MHILHFEKNYQYTDRERKAAARKVGKLATYCKHVKDEGSSIRVEVVRRTTKKSRDQVKVMITVKLPKKILRAQSRKHTLELALDRCIEKLEPQVKKYKEMQTRRR